MVTVFSIIIIIMYLVLRQLSVSTGIQLEKRGRMSFGPCTLKLARQASPSEHCCWHHTAPSGHNIELQHVRLLVEVCSTTKRRLCVCVCVCVRACVRVCVCVCRLLMLQLLKDQ